MAKGAVVVVVALAMLAVVMVQCVGRAEAGGYGGAIAEFAAGVQGEMEDLSAWEDAEDEFLDLPTRRLLAARRRSYVSYGALNGNRSPCPARSGRSYYTPNCNTNRQPVQPYRRGCYQITRCARG